MCLLQIKMLMEDHLQFKKNILAESISIFIYWYFLFCRGVHYYVELPLFKNGKTFLTQLPQIIIIVKLWLKQECTFDVEVVTSNL